jgi:hypothetical protein
MESQPADTVVLLRRGNKTKPGLFEQVVSMACQELWWFRVEWVRPDPALGREATFLRDVELARRADLVLAFFSSDRMTGGTAHVVDKAQDQGVPVYCWGMRGNTFVRIGELDEYNAWGHRMMRP